jgi:valyl-tRNA synthetase
MSELAKVYDPRGVERKWYDFWLEKRLFHADETRQGPRYSVVIPPPNVTGMLHMGHVLNNTLQDVMVRYRRMNGDNVLWMPGTDHAGIATQNVVEKQLAKEGSDRHALGREQFVARVWSWKEKYGGVILEQLRRLGASCDWERERFTMDPGLSAAVREVFVRLYEKGLIYRGHRIIHWCVRCHTALSDEEAVVSEGGEAGHLWHIRYPAADGGAGVVVATTRPETMLGDTGIAVHPEDERYAALLGRSVVLPLLERPIPVIADPLVDKEFGTGAVKVTPAHDANDFEMGQRHHLPAIVIMNTDGAINEEGGPYAGLDRDAARQRIVADLETRGLLVKTDDYRVPVRRCQRCDTVIEPYLSKQWFVKMAPLAVPAVAAVHSGRLRFVPGRWTGVYLHWLENIRDWCISRQLWWGHRIPVWYCDDCGAENVARVDPSACASCGSPALTQDADVLDTWFSSWLWPFSTMGWPERTATLARFYPTDMLATGADIIFFWVARMVMAGYEFMGDCPFSDVYLNSIVRDGKGRKMSKSLGNSPDPIDVIDQYGADALRFTIVSLAPVGQDVRFDADKTEFGRNFANKIWNAARFALMHLGEEVVPARDATAGTAALALPDRWILSRLQAVIDETRASFAEYRFNDAASALYRFLWGELCDWYLELIKPRLYGDDAAAKDEVRRTLCAVLEQTMRLLHPFMPFLSEEIWQALPVARPSESIMVAPYPRAIDAWRDAEAERQVAALTQAVTAIRNVRSEFGVAPSAEVRIRVTTAAGGYLEALRSYLGNLARVGAIELLAEGERRRGEPSAAVDGIGEIFVALGGAVDLAGVRERMQREQAKIDKDLQGVEKKLGSANFVDKAPAEVVDKEREKAAALRARRAVLEGHLASLRES